MVRKVWLLAILIAAIVELTLRPIHSEGQVAAEHHQTAGLSDEQRQRAEAGDAEAQYQLAVQYDRMEDPQKKGEALNWFRKAAEQGHPLAQVSVGHFYNQGRGGLDKDPRQAAAWFRKAADQGNALGQDELALLYETGEGVEQDDSEAVRWYSRAADQGLPVAQFDLAFMYEEGRGVAKDVEKAIYLYERAALSVPTARRNLAVIYMKGEGSVSKDPVAAYKWAVLAVSAEFQRILQETELDPEPRLGHAIILAEDIGKSMSKSQKQSGRLLAQKWIDSNASHLGKEPQMFATATKKLK